MITKMLQPLPIKFANFTTNIFLHPFSIPPFKSLWQGKKTTQPAQNRSFVFCPESDLHFRWTISATFSPNNSVPSIYLGLQLSSLLFIFISFIARRLRWSQQKCFYSNHGDKFLLHRLCQQFQKTNSNWKLLSWELSNSISRLVTFSWCIYISIEHWNW